MIELKCCSMDHVHDRAKAFTLSDLPYLYHQVRPDGVILRRLIHHPKGWRMMETIYVRLAGQPSLIHQGDVQVPDHIK